MIFSLSIIFCLSGLITSCQGQTVNTSTEYPSSERGDTIVEEGSGINYDNTEVELNATLDNSVESLIVEEDINGYAAMIDIRDEVSIEDEALILAHIDSDIEDFEDLKKTIEYLEKSIRRHADTNIVKSKELVEAHNVMKKLDEKVVTSYEQELKSLKSQISRLGHKYDNASINEIATIVENAEMFLQVSMDKIDELEMIEQEWKVAEESSTIQHMIDEDETKQYQSKIILEALKKSSVGGVGLPSEKISVNDESRTIASATSTKSSDKIKLDGGSMYEKIKKINSMMEANNKKEINEDPEKVVSTKVIISNDGNSDKDTGKNYSNVGDMQMDYDSDEGEVLESNDDIIENEPNFKERVKGGNRDNLFTEVTDKSLKSHDDKESVSASYLDLKTRGKYSVDHYSSKVKEALNTAKEKSHEFMDNKLGQETESGETEVEQTSSVSHLYIIIPVFGLMVLLFSVYVYRAFISKRRATVAFQNLSGFGNNERYTELESIKADIGWGKSWRTSHKKKQNKFR